MSFPLNPLDLLAGFAFNAQPLPNVAAGGNLPAAQNLPQQAPNAPVQHGAVPMDLDDLPDADPLPGQAQAQVQGAANAQPVHAPFLMPALPNAHVNVPAVHIPLVNLNQPVLQPVQHPGVVLQPAVQVLPQAVQQVLPVPHDVPEAQPKQNGEELFIALALAAEVERKKEQDDDEYHSVFLNAQGQYTAAGVDILKNMNKASFDRIVRFADQNHPEALFDLATCYRQGYWVPEVPKIAFEKVLEAANRGLALAQWILGDYYLIPSFVKHLNYDKPRRLDLAYFAYKAAAEQNLSIGQYNLAELYRWNRGGIPKNESTKETRNIRDQRAFHWYKRAADLGLAEAQWMVATYYQKSRGVPAEEINNRMALGLHYCELAAKQKFEPAVVELESFKVLANHAAIKALGLTKGSSNSSGTSNSGSSSSSSGASNSNDSADSAPLIFSAKAKRKTKQSSRESTSPEPKALPIPLVPNVVPVPGLHLQMDLQSQMPQQVPQIPQQAPQMPAQALQPQVLAQQSESRDGKDAKEGSEIQAASEFKESAEASAMVDIDEDFDNQNSSLAPFKFDDDAAFSFDLKSPVKSCRKLEDDIGGKRKQDDRDEEDDLDKGHSPKRRK